MALAQPGRVCREERFLKASLKRRSGRDDYSQHEGESVALGTPPTVDLRLERGPHLDGDVYLSAVECRDCGLHTRPL